jgi:hypothetical protein
VVGSRPPPSAREEERVRVLTDAVEVLGERVEDELRESNYSPIGGTGSTALPGGPVYPLRGTSD